MRNSSSIISYHISYFIWRKSADIIWKYQSWKYQKYDDPLKFQNKIFHSELRISDNHHLSMNIFFNLIPIPVMIKFVLFIRLLIFQLNLINLYFESDFDDQILYHHNEIWFWDDSSILKIQNEMIRRYYRNSRLQNIIDQLVYHI